MRTISFEGVATAITSIIHNGGEKNGIASMLRREKFVQPNGKVKEVPVISGNAIRGILRDVGMYDMLQKVGYGVQDDGTVKGLPLSAFYFLFSGGALSSTGEAGINVDRFRKMKDLIPLIGLFGGAIGNAIMPGKLKIGKLMPICKETLHLLPEKYQNEEAESIWDYCQTEMYTRRDDEKNDKVRGMIDENVRALLTGGTAKVDITKSSTAQQMMYRNESLAAGTQFYWKVTLEDASDIEFEAFVNTLIVFSKAPYLGGRSAVGHGEISIKMDKWIEIDSRSNLEGKEVGLPLLQSYFNHLEDKKQDIRAMLNTIV
jgi:hypothetical protein